MSKHRREMTPTGGLDLPTFARCDLRAHDPQTFFVWRQHCPKHEPVEYAKFSAEHRGWPEPEPVVP